MSITTILISPPFTFGLPVSLFLNLCIVSINLHLKCWTLTFHMKAWKKITQLTLTFLLTWRKPNQCYTPSITTTTLALHQALTNPLQPLYQSCKTDHLERLTSLPDINEPTVESQMNLKIISSLGWRILISANHLIGGGETCPISQSVSSLLFLVSILNHIRFCSCGQAHFLRWP